MNPIKMPVLFVGHGSPMNAIEDNEFSQAWQSVARGLPRPRAILCVSAHWETAGPQVTAMPAPRTIHDFGGFPRALFDQQYPAPGSPELAEHICKLIQAPQVQPDLKWGLDHGAWSVLCQMFPAADIPVIQLSLDRTRDGTFHYQLGQQLQPLRDEGILIVGSGNVVHNLRLMEWADIAFDWATEFDAFAKQCIETDNHDPLIHFQDLGRAAALSINSAEHYLPLLYALSLKQPGESVHFFAEKVWGGSMSMRGVQIG